MSENIFIINRYQYWEHSEGKLNKSLVSIAKEYFRRKNYSVKTTYVDDVYDIDTEHE